MLQPLKMTYLKLVVLNLFQHLKRSQNKFGMTREREIISSPHLSIVFFLIGIMSVVIGGCSSLEDSEVTMKVNSEKRKPKHELMPLEETPVENPSQAEKIPSIAPQVGIRIPLGK